MAFAEQSNETVGRSMPRRATSTNATVGIGEERTLVRRSLRGPPDVRPRSLLLQLALIITINGRRVGATIRAIVARSQASRASSGRGNGAEGIVDA